MVVKKLAFIIDKYVEVPCGGEPAINLNLIKHLLNLGYHIDVYCRQSNYVDRLLSINLFTDFEKHKDKYLKQIINENYDLIFAGKFAFKYPQIKANIISLHSHSDYYQQKKKFGILFDIFAINKKRVNNETKNIANNSDAMFLFCSKQLEKDYRSIVPITNSMVLYPYPNWMPSKDYSIKDNEVFTFGISALGFQNKGGYLSLISACLLKLSGKNFKLKIIYKKRQSLLQKFICWILGLQKCVEFLQIQKDMTSFYENIDCLLLPSKLESFGMVGIEAMAFSKPVICSSTCGLSEVIIDGKNGWIFKFGKNNVFNLYKKMLEACNFSKYSEVQSNLIESFAPNNENLYNDKVTELIERLL